MFILAMWDNGGHLGFDLAVTLIFDFDLTVNPKTELVLQKYVEKRYYT